MGFEFKTTDQKKLVGEAIASVLPDYRKPWYRVKHLLQLNLILIVPLLSAASSGFDGSLMNGLQSMTEWTNEFNNPTGTILGLINAAMIMGGIITLPFMGTLSDRFGRRTMLVCGLVGTIIATIIQATGTTRAQLIVSRFILGIFSVMTHQPAPLLVAELAYPTHRGKLTSLYFTSYFLGGIVASWSSYGCEGRGDSWAWRIPTILQASFPIIQLSFLWLVPESPRWLISKGNVEQAKSIFVKFHAGGDSDSPLVETEVTEIMNAIEMEKVAQQTTWTSFIATPGNRKRTYIAVSLGLFSQWCGVTVISYYITLVLDTIGITSSSKQTMINGLLQVSNYVFSVIAAFMVDLLGRRTLFMWSSIGMFVSIVIWTACSAVFNQTGSVPAGKCVVALIFIFFFHFDIAYAPLLMSYPTEIFPYSMRSKGVALSLCLSFCGLLMASFCNSVALSAIGWKYYIVFCVTTFFMVINNYFFYPETRGYSLEEIAVLFDGNHIEDLEVLLSQGGFMGQSEKKGVQVEHIESVSDRN